MSLRLPFFGLLSRTSPMDGLIEHYGKIAECLEIIRDSLECYVTGGTCRAMEELAEAVDTVEADADRIKRRIRNHLPRRLFMAVDKTLFLNYTNRQDNILDSAQDALQWLAMRRISLTAEQQKDLVNLLDAVSEGAKQLGPALKATITLVNGTSLDREGTKKAYRKVRKLRDSVMTIANDLNRKTYNSDMDFKDIYQIIHFVDCLRDMSSNAEGCVDILRAMIAR